MRSLALLGLLATIPACNLDLGGTAQPPDAAAPESGGETLITMAPDSSPNEGAVDSGRSAADANAQADAVANDASPALADGGRLCPTVPSGWSLAVYDLAADPCPQKFASHDVVGQPTLGAGACSCVCNVTQEGSCTQGTLSVMYGTGGAGSCNTPTWTATFTGPSCTALGSPVSVSGSPSNVATPLAPQGGTCSQMVHPDSSQLSTAKARYCDVPTDSADAVCNGTVPSGFAACLLQYGDVACPTGTPFTQKYIVEDHATLQCSACSGSCAVVTTCSNATVTGYSDSSCMTRIGSVPVDGTCTPVMFYASLPSTLVAVEYAATASSTCSAGSSVPTAQLTNPRTLCCR